MGIEKFEGKKAFGWYHVHPDDEPILQHFVFEEEHFPNRWQPDGHVACNLVCRDGIWVLDSEVIEPADLKPESECGSCRDLAEIKRINSYMAWYRPASFNASETASEKLE